LKENIRRGRYCLACLIWLAASLLAQTYDFSDGGRRTKAALEPAELYVTVASNSRQQDVAAKLIQGLGEDGVIGSQQIGGSGLLLRLERTVNPSKDFARSARAEITGVESIAPVFYDLSELPSAEKLAAMPEAAAAARRQAARRIATSKLLVRMEHPEEKWSALAPLRPLDYTVSLLKGWYLVSFPDAFAALDAAGRMTRDGGWEFTPVFARSFERRQASGTLQRSVNDPLFEKQWHLAVDNGIRMNASWDVATGRGINVAIVDDGLDVKHEDLTNAYPLETNYHRNFNEGTRNDPAPAKPDQNHGTACAGLVAATGFNNLGVIGVAPEARLMGLRLIADPAGDDATGEALAWQPAGLVTHVSSNSWGPTDDGMDLGRSGALQRAGLQMAAINYRGGLGTIFSVSAGNGREEGDDSSYDEFSGSRFVIGVGAINRKGEPSSYSEAGMNVAISAMGGETKPPEMVWTTNNSGEAALADLQEKFETSTAPVHYTDAFNGTSAAAPQVSGAAALLLQRNPNLGYRDVKEILMRTARKTGLSGGDEFRDNGGGFSFSHNFGAGALNVSAALDLASNWVNLGPLRLISMENNAVQSIPDGSLAGATFSFDFSNALRLRVESVEVIVNVEHAKRGDVGFVIISPSGMISVAENRPKDEGANFEDFLFTSVRHWGENSAGVWRVRIIDVTGNGIQGRAGDISVRIYGTER
jgi:subtilisin family serine protease